ncbi:MAG: hypothetical protein HYS13_16180 [Planctomycetia bacterium]|nr:hypothetical protein [Planctomycetia bacterium]
MIESTLFKGVIHGKTIELAEATGLPEGQRVTVILQPESSQAASTEEGLRLAFGACADEAADLDAYLAWTREQRKIGRRPVDP